MTDKKLAAQAYCAVATKLEAAKLVSKDARDALDDIYAELENLRGQMGDGLESDETIVILLPEKVSVVVSHNGAFIEATISRTV